MGKLARILAFESPAAATGSVPYARLFVAAVATALAAAGEIFVGRAAGQLPALWPASALLVVVLMRSCAAHRPAYLAAGLLGNVVANIAFGDSFLMSLGFALCSSLQTATAAALLTWRQNALRATSRTAGTGLAIWVGAVAPLGAASLTTVLAAKGDASGFGALWLTLYARDALGSALLLPFALVVQWSDIAALFSRARLPSTAVTLGAIVAVDALVFGQQLRPLLFFVPPMLTWAAFRLGVAGTALGMLLTVTLATFATAQGHGPLMLAQSVSPVQRMLLLQVFLAIVACTTLPVAAVLHERDKLSQRLLARFAALTESHGDLSKRNAQIEALIGLQEGIAGALPSRRAVVDFILNYAQTQTKAMGAVMERVAGDELVYEVATGPFAAAIGLRVKRNASLSGACSIANEVMRCDDAAADDRVDAAQCERLNIRSMIVVPIAGDGFVTAVLKVASDRRYGFTEFDELSLQLVAQHLASAIRAADEYERSERTAAEVQATLEHLSEGVVVFGPDLEVLRYNAAATRLLMADFTKLPRWVGAGELVDLDGRVLAPDERPVRRAFLTGDVQRDVVVGNGPGGIGRRWVSLTVTPIRFDGERPERYVLSARDVTTLQQSEIDQREYVSQLRSLHLIASQVTTNGQEQIDAALVLCRGELGLDWAYLCVLDALASELVIESSVGISNARGAHPLGARLPLERTFIGPVLESKDVLAIADLTAALMDRPQVSVDGAWGAYIAVPIRVSGVTYGAIGFTGRLARVDGFTESERDFVRITGDLIGSAIERRIQRERLDALAYFDALTGLPNRVVFQDRLVQTLLAAKRYDERFAVFYIDLDGFKAVNDGYGHGAGDEVLATVGRRLEKLMRESDTVARIGGDEFLILAPKVGKRADASDLAWRVVQALRAPIDIDGHAHHVTASIGVSVFPDDGTDAVSIVERADAALYRAKLAGKNAVAFASEPAAVFA